VSFSCLFSYFWLYLQNKVYVHNPQDGVKSYQTHPGYNGAQRKYRYFDVTMHFRFPEIAIPTFRIENFYSVCTSGCDLKQKRVDIDSFQLHWKKGLDIKQTINQP
jgi:hypothetical protein